MKFTIDPEGIALDAETIIDLQRFEVQSVGAVVLTRHGDVLAVEHARIALHAPGQRLYNSSGYRVHHCRHPWRCR